MVAAAENEPRACLISARWYAEHGWHVFPVNTPGPNGCSCGSRCARIGKHPRTMRGMKDATTDLSQVERWWQGWRNANIGIATGPSGLVVIDVDARNGGHEHWAALVRELGEELTHTRTVRTGGGGLHLYFEAPAATCSAVLRHRDRTRQDSFEVQPEPITSSAGLVARGIDVRAAGGYVIAPPSLHESGARYEWVDPTVPVMPLPEALRERLLQARTAAPAAPPVDGPIPEGSRNDTLFRIASALRQQGLNEQEILEALQKRNARCQPPLPEREVQGIARNAVKYTQLPGKGPRTGGGGAYRGVSPSRGLAGGGSRAAGTGETRPAAYNLTDRGNAQRLVARHGTDMRFCHAWNRWLVWDGKRWAADSDEEMMRRAKETVGALFAAAGSLGEEEGRRALLKHAMRSESKGKLEAMVELARSEPGIPIAPAELDADPMLLCCPNGTVDLRTGILREHRRQDLITRTAGIRFDRHVRSSLWDRFLRRITGENGGLTAYLQRAAGYTLTGQTGEEVLFFLHGSGRNGKSKFLGALHHAMGEYARTTRPETIMARDRPQIPNDIAALAGARMVSTTEIEDGSRLAESLVKQLTGGDLVSARFLNAEFFEFRPHFALWIAANHRPRIHGTDAAIWERIHVIPFTVTIPPEERDKRLAQKLEREASGILRWMVEGCLAWQREGLMPPAEVRQATQTYRAEMDVLAGFLEERCEPRPGSTLPTAELYAAYTDWCETSGERAWSQRTLALKLKERGLESRRMPRGKIAWCNLALTPPCEACEASPRLPMN